MITTDECPRCKSRNVRIEMVTKIHNSNEKPFEYVDEFSHCLSCGEEYYTPEQSRANSAAYTTAMGKATNTLSAAEIREARVALGLTQDQFEDALGVGRKTVVRWERGTVAPGRAANGLLWFALRKPQAFREYVRERIPELDRLGEPIATHIVTSESAVTALVLMSGAKRASHGTLRDTVSGLQWNEKKVRINRTGKHV